MRFDGANKVKIDEALTRFSRSGGSDLIEASDVLIGANALAGYAKDARMKAGLDRLVDEIEGGPTNFPILLACGI